MIARFISLIAVAVADNEGSHHLNEAAAISLLQTSSSMKMKDPNTFGAKGGAKEFGAKGTPKIPSPGPPSGGGGGDSCKAAKDALKTAREAKNTECPEEPVDPDELGSHNKDNIFPPPVPNDPSSLKSCDEGWMPHTTANVAGQCWGVGGNVNGPLGSVRMTPEMSQYLTPSACLELVYKLSRLSGACNPNATKGKQWTRQNYKFSGCVAEFHDTSGPDVAKLGEVMHPEWDGGWYYNNLRGQTKFGTCMMCGKGPIGDGNLVYGFGNNTKVTIGKAAIARRDFDLELKKMTCILNPEEKDGFEVFDAN